MSTVEHVKLEQNVAQVSKYLDRIEPTNLLVADEKALDKMVGMRETLAVLVEQVKAELPRNEQRKNLVRGLTLMHNETASVIDLSSERDLGKVQANEFVGKNKRRIYKVATLISALRKQAGEAALRGTEETSASSTPSVLEMIDRSGGSIKEYQNYRQLLPLTNRETNKSFIIVRVPIVAKTKPYVSAKDFEAAHIRTGSIGGYPVLEDQLVIGLNVQKLKDEKKKIPEFRKSVIQIIEGKMHQKFNTMSPMNIGLGNTGFVFTWLMPEKDLTKVHRSLHRTFSVIEWGFAFRDR